MRVATPHRGPYMTTPEDACGSKEAQALSHAQTLINIGFAAEAIADQMSQEGCD